VDLWNDRDVCDVGLELNCLRDNVGAT
jgi:hypothetical protein